MAIVLRREAERDLIQIDRFSIEQFGEAVAAEYMRDLDRAFTQLEEHPAIGAPVPNRRREIRSFPCRSHRIYYQFDGRRVIVVRVLQQAQNAISTLLK